MSVVDDVKSRLDILEVVSQHVTLQRSGRSYKANCPFHQEKTPSFYVFPERQSWRCFGACATGGDAFSFVMKAENLDFAEALRRLAQKTGVELPNRERRAETQVAFQVNEAARGYFQQVLGSAEGQAVREYLKGRGFNQASFEKFEFGLSPRDGRSLRDYLTKHGFTPEQLAQAGVARLTDRGQYIDLFRGRLIIPIRNGQGELAGFGSRALDDSKPKYLNSPRTPVFDKGRILYALNFAKDAIRKQGIVIVEGYMDAIMAHQYGFNNVVASMGTALTEHQVAEVRRLTGNITMALDPDAAGQQATLRSLESSWRVFQRQAVSQAPGVSLFQRPDPAELKVAALPDGKDPDEIIKDSPEQWASLVAQGTPLLEYLFTTLSAQLDLTTPQGKARLSELVFPLIAAVTEPAQQDYYFQKLAAHLGVSEETLQASLGRPGAHRPSRRPTAVAATPQATTSAFARLDHDPVEEYCLALLLQNPELLPEAAADLRPDYFRRLENRAILEPLLAAGGEPAAFDLAELPQRVDPGWREHLERLQTKKLPGLERPQRQRALHDTLRRLEERHLRELKAEEGLRFAEEPPDVVDAPPQEALELNQRIKWNESRRNGLTQRVSPQR